MTVGRVAAIGLDSVEWWCAQQLMDGAQMPNLARLRDDSAVFTLRSPAAYRSELVWARFLTGREPIDAKDWAASMAFDPSTYALTTTPASGAPPFFAGPDDIVTVAFDPVHARPGAGVRGAQVVGWGTHSPRWPRSSNPPGLLTEIDERFGAHPAFGNDFFSAWYDPDYLAALADACVDGAGRRAEITSWLLSQHPDWELLLTGVSDLHSLGHHAWHGMDASHPLHHQPSATGARRAFERVASAVDAALGEVVASLPPDTAVLIFSLHGFEPADDVAGGVLLPELLHRLQFGRGLLRSPRTSAWRRAGCPPVVPEVREHWDEIMRRHFAASPAASARRALRDALPAGALEALQRVRGIEPGPPASSLPIPIPSETTSGWPDAVAALCAGPDHIPAGWYRPHWPRMRAFALPTFADGHIRLNVVGREHAGLIAPADYERTCDEVEEAITRCRDARTGAPVIREVLRPRSSDPFDPDGPADDLLVHFEGAPDAIDHPQVGVIGPFPHQRTGSHSDRGFAMLRAPGVAAGEGGERDAKDLPPTILALLGRDPSRVLGSSLLDRR